MVLIFVVYAGRGMGWEMRGFPRVFFMVENAERLDAVRTVRCMWQAAGQQAGIWIDR